MKSLNANVESKTLQQKRSRMAMHDPGARLGTPDRPEQVRTCSECGCTEDDCFQCIEAQGFPCHWVAEDLCSRCAEEGGES